MVTFLGLEVTLTNGEPSANFLSGIYRCDGNYLLNDPVELSHNSLDMFLYKFEGTSTQILEKCYSC